MPFVLDASVALAWYLPGQGNPYAESVYRRLNADAEGAAAPLLWRTELAAVLIKATRRKMLTETSAYAALGDAEALPIALHDLRLTSGELFRLAKRYNLSVYDVHYIELARRLELPLATADRGMKAAARRQRLPIYQA
jgi:predicted nucleic acid-binding protein